MIKVCRRVSAFFGLSTHTGMMHGYFHPFSWVSMTNQTKLMCH